MPTKAQLLELNAGLTKDKKDLQKTLKATQKDLDDARELAKKRVVTFNEMKKSNATRGTRVEELSTTVRGLENELVEVKQILADTKEELHTANATIVRYRKRIPWWKSKK